jgi:hypothetical protein
MDTVTTPGAAVLKPYDGAHHSLPDGCPKVLTTFSGDVSARVTYEFNSLGFRGEEFCAAADRHIFVSGCSIAFGLGLDYAEAWVSVFRRGYAELHHLPPASINLQNFSTSGCSNAYIARTLIGQCERFRPTLALATLTFPERAELLHNGRSYNIGRWCLMDTWDDGAADDGHDRTLRDLIRTKARAHYDLYSPLAGEQELLKNALLLQLYFQSRGIPFLIAMVRTGDGRFPADELLAPWRDLLDRQRVFTILMRDCLVDESASRFHPGPAGSRMIAERFLSRYRELHAHAPAAGNRLAIDALADTLRRNHDEGSAMLATPPLEDPNVYPLF